MSKRTPSPSYMQATAHWERFIMESWRLSFSLAEVMGARSLMIAAAMSGETSHQRELEDMVSEKFAVLPEIGSAMMQEGMRLATSGRTHFSDADVLAWQKAVSAPVYKRVRANAKRLRKKK